MCLQGESCQIRMMACLKCSLATVVCAMSREAALAADDHHLTSVTVMTLSLWFWSFYIYKNCHLPPEQHLCLNCLQLWSCWALGGPRLCTHLPALLLGLNLWSPGGCGGRSAAFPPEVRWDPSSRSGCRTGANSSSFIICATDWQKKKKIWFWSWLANEGRLECLKKTHFNFFLLRNGKDIGAV